MFFHSNTSHTFWVCADDDHLDMYLIVSGMWSHTSIAIVTNCTFCWYFIPYILPLTPYHLGPSLLQIAPYPLPLHCTVVVGCLFLFTPCPFSCVSIVFIIYGKKYPFSFFLLPFVNCYFILTIKSNHVITRQPSSGSYRQHFTFFRQFQQLLALYFLFFTHLPFTLYTHPSWHLLFALYDYNRLQL